MFLLDPFCKVFGAIFIVFYGMGAYERFKSLSSEARRNYIANMIAGAALAVSAIGALQALDRKLVAFSEYRYAKTFLEVNASPSLGFIAQMNERMFFSDYAMHEYANTNQNVPFEEFIKLLEKRRDICMRDETWLRTQCVQASFEFNEHILTTAL